MNRREKGHYRASCERLRLTGLTCSYKDDEVGQFFKERDFQTRSNRMLEKATKLLKNKEKTKAIGEKLRAEREIV